MTSELRAGALAASAVLFTSAQSVTAQTPPRTVTLPLTEYNRLVDLSSRPAPAAPVGAVISAAELRVRVERDMARGVFSLTGDALRPGVNRVNLVTGATLLGASVAGGPLALTADQNTHAALVPGPGPFALTLEWGAPLTFSPGRASFVLPVPHSGTAHATIDLPGESADVHVSSGLVTRRVAADGRTVVDVTLNPGLATAVSWSMRDSAPVAAARHVRMVADVLTLVSLGDADVRMVGLIDIAVVQGEPRVIDVQLPSGYDLTGATGSSLESSQEHDGTLVLNVSDPAARRHQFLVTLERAHSVGSFALDTDVIALPTVQRERGEIAIEGVGTLELATTERGAVHRMDVRELNRALQSLAERPIMSAFRYQRTAGGSIGVAIDVKRFGDAGVLAAVADRAVATTLVTSEGRALTEIVLTVQNHAQPFLKVALPRGATIVSVEVAGEAAKPVLGSDGTRVPLLRAGFRPRGSYPVSFVYLDTGMPFAKKGDLQLALPKLDIPVSLLEWELFVPGSYTARVTDGNVIDRRLLAGALATPGVTGSAVGHSVGGSVSGSAVGSRSAVGGGSAGTAGVGGSVGGIVSGLASAPPPPMPGGAPGQIRGRALDASGATLAGVTVMLNAKDGTHTAVTDADGGFFVSGVPDGPVTIRAELPGFRTESRSLVFDKEGRTVDFTMSLAETLRETVTVTGVGAARGEAKAAEAQNAAAPSANVIELQRRAAGVLPVRVDVPRAGTSHQFVKPLVIDQEARVTLRYKRR